MLHGGRTALELLSNIYDLRTSTSHIVPSSNRDWPVYALKQGREPPGNAPDHEDKHVFNKPRDQNPHVQGETRAKIRIPVM